MIILYERNLEENINESIKTLEYHISSQNYPIVNENVSITMRIPNIAPIRIII